MRWLHRILLNSCYYRQLILRTKSIVPRGFGSLNLYTAVVMLIDEFLNGNLVYKASSLAYNFMLAVFPGTIFLFTLIPYIPVKNFQQELLHLLYSILPTNAYLAFQATIVDIVKNQHGKLLSLGFITALYFATNGISTLMRAFNNSSLVAEKRTWVQRRIIATLLTVVISVFLLIAVVILIAGQWLISLLKSHIASGSHFWLYVIVFSRWIIIVFIFFAAVSLLYRYGPSHKIKWKILSPGAIISTVLAVITSLGFAYYVNHFSSYNKIYGSIGTLIVVMIWLYINSLILLIGFELNASIDLSKRQISKPATPRHNSFREKINKLQS